MPKKKETPEYIEPTVEELVEQIKEEEEALDPDAKTLSMREMSFMLTSQTFALVGSLGGGLKTRYDQVVAMEFENLPPKARKEKEQWKKGYIAALNDVAEGLLQYQNEITERGIKDGILTRDDVPDLPEPEAAAQETVEGLE